VALESATQQREPTAQSFWPTHSRRCPEVTVHAKPEMQREPEPSAQHTVPALQSLSLAQNKLWEHCGPPVPLPSETAQLSLVFVPAQDCVCETQQYSPSEGAQTLSPHCS
jgi:hypothetical protein